MNILMVSNGVYPERIGGIEVCVAELSKRLVDAGHDVSLLVPKPVSPTDSPPDFCNVDHYSPSIRLFDNPISTYPYRYITDRANEIDLVHGHSHLFSGAVLGAMACSRNDIPYVLTSHGIRSQTAPKWVNVPYNKSVAKWTFRSAEKVLTYTETEIEIISDLGADPNYLHHITRGIDLESLHPNYNLSTDPIKLLWVSRFAPGKGPDIVVDLVKTLQDRGADAEATLIGEGPEEENILEQIRANDLSDFVTIRNFLSESELHREYAQATFFILPSVSEGMNRTILEAMAAGTPPVISDLDHFYDIVEGCGAVVNKRDPVAFADAVEELLSHDLSDLAQSSRKRVKGEFTWNQTVEEIQSIYYDLVETA